MGSSSDVPTAPHTRRQVAASGSRQVAASGSTQASDAGKGVTMCYFASSRRPLSCLLLLFFFDHIGIHFSPEEVVLFTKRMENGYDLTHDQRYNLWQSMHSSSDLTSFGKCVTE